MLKVKVTNLSAKLFNFLIGIVSCKIVTLQV